MNQDELVRKDGRIISPHFSSYADRVCVEATGSGQGPLPCAKLYCNTADGGSQLYETYPAEAADGLYRCSFFFDPINLQIYRNAISFCIVFRDFSDIIHFSAEECTDSATEALDVVSHVFTDAEGNHRVPVLQADRTTQVTVSTVPRHVLFVGNSILLGMHGAYGMCASSPRHDYFYYVQQAILAHSPDCCFSKLHGSMFEHSASREEFEDWWASAPNSHTGKPAKESFTADLDLIILQLGDNVGTQALANFLHCTPILLERIKTLCPRARVLWVHGWFNSPLTTPPITRFCEEWRLERVDVLCARAPESQSFSGATYEAANGSVATVKDIWVTHPGNLGMRLIADRIIETLSL